MSVPPGKVFLIGAGPGDPELLTLAAVDALGRADVVLKDHLVHPGALRHLKPGAEVLHVGKQVGKHCASQDEINGLLIEQARRGRTVARLKGGDPFVFGRGAEEALALHQAGIPWEVIPGVTAANGVCAYAGIPLLLRGMARSVAFISGHEVAEDEAPLPPVDTLVVYMGATRLAAVAARALRSTFDPLCPVAVVSEGTLPGQQVFLGTLQDLALLSDAAAPCPALTVIGRVAALCDLLGGLSPRPLNELPRRASAPQSPLASAR